MKVIKRDGSIAKYDNLKIENAIKSAFKESGETYDPDKLDMFIKTIPTLLSSSDDENIDIEAIQDTIEGWLMINRYFKTAKAYILYRETHKNTRFLKDRIDYMTKYINSNDNAASSSETDDNANVLLKNVSNLNGEVYKSTNRLLQRLYMKMKLNSLYGNGIGKQYIKDLENHIIYQHDEASYAGIFPYCSAYTLYPLLLEGVGNIDGVTPSAPNNLDSFCGQFVNLVFLLASQVKGAVAFGGLFVAFNWYCVKEWGDDYHEKCDSVITTDVCKRKETIRSRVNQYFQQIIWGMNQPSGNRSSQSPFSNVSYYDSNYFKAMFDGFCYPDGTHPKWEQIDWLQREFMNKLNTERLSSVIAFPVETMCLLSDGEKIIDNDYREFTAQMYAKGHSFFTYISDSPTSLSSCCRLKSDIIDNTFSFTNGLSGMRTGSCNVITLNMSRIIQNFYMENKVIIDSQETFKKYFKPYFEEILERVYKYHTAYKTMLYELEKKGMFTASTAHYIQMSDLYSTIGINGINEAAMFMGLEVGYNHAYTDFCRFITSTVKECNKAHTTDKFRFNQEFVPAESLGIKNFNWDKQDGYWTPTDGRVLYNSYFYDAHDDTSPLDKIRLHGKKMTETLDGGVGCHINLDEHLDYEQYLHIIDFACKEGCSYFTFNIPNTKCDKCGFITKHNVDECPKCHGTDLTKYTRVIGYLRPVKSFSKGRQIEEKQRTYTKKSCLNIQR